MDSKQKCISDRQQRSTQDVACVIHGDLYPWEYVEKLYSMVHRHITSNIRFHVFTEHDRPVPAHMIKHALQDWPGISGRKKAWWYKMQMFDSRYIQGRVLYFDLDVVIIDNLDWMWHLDPQYFWTIHDFKFLFKPNWQGINSSVMLWDTTRFDWVWAAFQNKNIAVTVKEFHGDQDYLTKVLGDKHIRFFESSTIKSWRWQIKDGGMDMKSRIYRRPGAGSVIDQHTKILIFHGHPKPHEIQDALIDKCWTISK